MVWGTSSWQVFSCHIEYCPNRMLLLLYSHLGGLQLLLQPLEHFGCGRLASCLPPRVDRVVSIYLFTTSFSVNGSDVALIAGVSSIFQVGWGLRAAGREFEPMDAKWLAAARVREQRRRLFGRR